jgi:hypothetical protein
LCADCCAIVETLLAAAPQLIDQLDIAISKQAKVGGAGKGGLARERAPINFGALAVRDALLVELALWGDDINEIRRHPKVAEIVRDLGRAVKDAYRAIDRAQERQYLGKCMNVVETVTCYEELWARPGAKELRCRNCSYEHNVANRRLDMMEMAADMLVTVKEASRYLGAVGHITVTEASIRGYIHRGVRLAYRPGTTMIRLGDLLAVVVDEGERKSA